MSSFVDLLFSPQPKVSAVKPEPLQPRPIEPPVPVARTGLTRLRNAGGFLSAGARRARATVRLWRLYWMQAQLRFVPTETQRLFALTIVIGIFSGLAAVAFHVSLRFAEQQMIDRAMSASGNSWLFWTIATPILGGIICGALLQYVVPQARGSGIPQVKAAFAARGRLRFRDSLGKFVVSVLQIGSGASLGREGPTVQICAGIASLFGRLARVSPRSLRRLLPVGAAAGIAAAFNAPIAAVTFTIEEIVGDLDRSVLSGVIIAAAVAAVIERSLLGEHPVFQVAQGHGLTHASSLLLYALLGLLAAFVSILFTDSLLYLRQWFSKIGLLPAWSKPAVGGLVTGALAIAALAWLGSRGVTGGGYDTLSLALAGSTPVKVMLVLCLFKVAATVFSYSSGGAGGIFAPALFIGGMLGGAVGTLDVHLLHHDPGGIGAFALVGMGAVFSGIIRAPMTSVLIIIEMTSGYSLILPLMLANMTAYGLVRHFRPTPVYEALLEQDGIRLREKAVMDVLESMHVDKVLVRTPWVAFDPTTRVPELVRTEGSQEVYPVVGVDGALVGLITVEELRLLRAEPDLGALVNAADIMRPPVAATPHDDLHAALEMMLANQIARLPVVDGDGKVIGFVGEDAIAKVYLRGRTSHSD